MAKFILTVALSALALSTCAQPDSSAIINWPAAYEPSKSKFHVHNEIAINASPEKVWRLLIDALQWPAWYKGAKNVAFIDGTDTVLTAASVFKWQTMGLQFQSAIKEFEPYRLLAWESRKKQIQGYHVWLIVPAGEGCKVITDESQNGWLTFFEKIFQPKKLKKLHDGWLSKLKQQSETF